MEHNTPNNQRGQTNANSRTPSVIEADADQKKPAPRKHSADPDHKKSYRRAFRSASPLTKLQLLLTAIVAIATFVYAGFSGWQLYVIRAGGEDTRRLADAAQKQANASGQQVNAMQRQINAMQDQANSMRAQTDTLNDSLEQTRKVADATTRQSKVSEAMLVTMQLQTETLALNGKIALQDLDMRTQGSIGIQVKLNKLEVGEGMSFSIIVSNTSIGHLLSSSGGRVDFSLNQETVHVKMPNFDVGPREFYEAQKIQTRPLSADDLKAVQAGAFRVRVEIDLKGIDPPTAIVCFVFQTKPWEAFGVTDCGENNKSKQKAN